MIACGIRGPQFESYDPNYLYRIVHFTKYVCFGIFFEEGFTGLAWILSQDRSCIICYFYENVIFVIKLYFPSRGCVIEAIFV